ncbi:putative F-box domain-containing protein [Medicago truncatula]|uniref:Putative F-box domain-containing protein n=1 Tax=Medicago truncatula TaxID=3880 RepID=A0A396IW49_MEDTR|nr:putative F-box domain-containing protein [Medicago truncatula]
MVPNSACDDRNRTNVFSSFPLTEEPTTTTTRTLTSQSLNTVARLPTLPFELVEEILCRLPVKILMQLQCICKSWKSLISNDRKFAKKHLRMSKRVALIVSSVNDSGEPLFWDSSISSVFSNASNSSSVTQTQLICPFSLTKYLEICSCDGILCFTIARRSSVLWNPSIIRYNMLPPLENPEESDGSTYLYSFGYDHFNDVYKVVAISHMTSHILVAFLDQVYFSSCAIVSLDLETESYQKLWPDFGMDYRILTLRVFKDCLCILTCSHMFLDVWIMKEYGNIESWTKLYSVPFLRNWGIYPYPMAFYISEDD